MVGDLTFVRPSGWEWVTSESKTRKAEMKVWDATKSKNADVTFYWFEKKEAAGKPEECIKRWKAQFTERERLAPKVETLNINKCPVTYVMVEGTFKTYQEQDKKIVHLPDYVLLGTVIETKKGNIMIRMTGPKTLAAEATDGLKLMVQNALMGE